MTTLAHVGVLGMKWGKRKARGLSGAINNVTNSKLFKATVYDKDDTTGLIFKKSEVEKLKKMGVNAKAAVSKIVQSKAFKAMVYDKDNTVGLIFKKSEVAKIEAKASKIKAKVDSIIEKNKNKPVKQLTDDERAKRAALTSLAFVGLSIAGKVAINHVLRQYAMNKYAESVLGNEVFSDLVQKGVKFG